MAPLKEGEQAAAGLLGSLRGDLTGVLWHEGGGSPEVSKPVSIALQSAWSPASSKLVCRLRRGELRDTVDRGEMMA